MDFYSNLDSRLLDRQTPTLFEILSANELEQLLSPSVRYVLVHYANRYPRYLIRILNNFDSLNLLVRGIIELRYLKSWNSTFIEKFYGLKRVSKPRAGISSIHHNGTVSPKLESLTRLRKIQIVGSLLDILFVPFVRERLDLLYERLLPSYVLRKLKPGKSIKEFLQYTFVRLYPTVVLLLKLIDIAFKILFIGGRLKSTTLLQYLFNIEYSRLNQYDYDLDEKRVGKFLSGTSEPSSRVRPESLTESIVQAYSDITLPLKKVALVTSNSVLPASIFLLKFLEWWNTSNISTNFSKGKKNTKTPERPDILPPTIAQDGKVRRLLTTKNNLCRICHSEIHNPAIIETGYVFCYPCIYNYLRDGDKEEGGRCPVTGKKLLGCKYSDTLKQWKVNGIRRLMI